ncbi:aspartyl/asparaginyl beta-hydroxylase domain-containing protein [Planctobacterium marinum]|uniref:Aspartyl/asparaginyl beta-hydroxylase n=1 Tax=Planctobacterium marinum TaxID=1631968 RepID=A0AA48HQP3_9ALTE|nr:aspartyl/asparaginyl beta-hydroxylase [Planctobacterium marinum]
MQHLSSLRLKHVLPFFENQIQAELSSIDSAQWVDHVNTNTYEGSWRVFPLRTLRENKEAHPIIQSFQIETGRHWVDLPVLGSLLSIQAIIKSIPVCFYSIRLMLLQPQGFINEHRDRGLNLENGCARLHVPLQTHNEVSFISNGVELPMEAGDLWYINADQPHSVENKGSISRINLVLDCEVNDWLTKKVSLC